MSEKNIKSRIVHKHDIEANWLLATNFSPRAGEFIIYDPDENNPHSRVKIGDGKTNVNNLPFIESSRAEIADKATEADHATTADTATEAGHATSADTATNANHAVSADKATQADMAVNAGHATSADKASKADSATTADTLDGKHASDFALAIDLDALETLVGDTSVATQISEAIAEIPQSDWNQTDETAVDYIKNKPLAPTDEELLELLVETGIIDPITNNTGAIFVDNNNKIYVL